MTELAHKTHIREIERVVEHLFENWMNKQFFKLDQYFHNHGVMIEPGTAKRLTGAEEIIENYRDFIEEAEIFDYSINELSVDLFDETAVVYLTYRIKYRVEQTNYDESNTDILVFRKHNRHWQIVWRTQLLGQ